MTLAAQQLIRSFETLDAADKHEVLVRLLRQPLDTEYGPVSDDELRSAADQVFLELDMKENA